MVPWQFLLMKKKINRLLELLLICFQGTPMINNALILGKPSQDTKYIYYTLMPICKPHNDLLIENYIQLHLYRQNCHCIGILAILTVLVSWLYYCFCTDRTCLFLSYFPNFDTSFQIYLQRILTTMIWFPFIHCPFTAIHLDIQNFPMPKRSCILISQSI